MHVLFFTKLESTRYLANRDSTPDGSITDNVGCIAPITAVSPSDSNLAACTSYQCNKSKP